MGEGDKKLHRDKTARGERLIIVTTEYKYMTAYNMIWWAQEEEFQWNVRKVLHFMGSKWMNKECKDRNKSRFFSHIHPSDDGLGTKPRTGWKTDRKQATQAK